MAAVLSIQPSRLHYLSRILPIFTMVGSWFSLSQSAPPPLPINLQYGAFITDSILQLMEGVDNTGGGLNVEVGDSGKGSESSAAHGSCNPLLWQTNNAGLVEQKVMKHA